MSLKEEGLDIINLYFKMTLPNKLEENFKLEIPKVKLEDNQSIDVLYELFKNLKKENLQKDEEIKK